MNDIAFVCRGIKKTYGKDENSTRALRGIDLEVKKGELTLLVGPSGSGKTTLLSIITTILTPDSGELIVLNKQVNGMSEDEKANLRNKSLGVVFQSLYLIPSLTVLENVALPLIVAGVSEEEANKKALAILTELNISHKANFPPDTLSRGQQQRVAVGRSLINDSEIIVCDEPTSSLDHAGGMEIMGLLKNLATPNRAIFVVTHDHRIYSFADRIITMDDGVIVKEEKYA